MSIALAQAKLDAGRSPIDVTLDDPVTAGSLIVVFIWGGSAGIVVGSVEDNKGNTYTPVSTPVGNCFVQYYAYNVVGGSSFQVTVTKDPYNYFDSTYVYVVEWTGNFHANPLVDHAEAGGASLAAPNYDLSAGTVTPTAPNALVAGHFQLGLTNNKDAHYPNTEAYVGAGYYMYMCAGVQASSAAYEATASASASSAWLATVAIYQELDSWVDIADFVEQEIPSSAFPSGAARVLGYLWSSDASAVLQARLYNVTDDSSAGESAELSGDTPQACDFAVTLASGTKTYRLQVTSDIPDTDIFMSSRGVGP